MTQPRVGYSTVDWSPDHLLLALNQIASLGFAGVEVGTEAVQIYHEREDEFANLLEKTGVELAAVHAGLVLTDEDYREADLELARHAVTFLSEVSGGGILVLRASEPEPSRRQALVAAVDVLLQIADLSESASVKLCLKPHLRTAFWTGQDVTDLLELTVWDQERIKLCVDTAHLVLAGTDVVELIRGHPGRIGHVHLTDLRKNVEEDFTPLADAGAGVLDLGPVAAAIRDIGYDGWIIGRVDTPERSPNESARHCAEHFASLGLAIGNSAEGS